ncbi:MAG: hypothetical protein KBH99_01080 [Syntrophobacteraceae bacterium]|nr:hypothetical protein [Syntrophobacteraceae bacterium]
MEEHPPEHLLVLRQLAQEYQKKYLQLEEFAGNTEPDRLLAQLRTQAELVTDRFRSLEARLLMELSPSPSRNERDEIFRVATELCRCFDEMRILYQFLLESKWKSTESQ